MNYWGSIRIKWSTGGETSDLFEFPGKHALSNGFGKEESGMCGPWFSLPRGLQTPHRMWCRGGSYTCPEWDDGARPGLNHPQRQTFLPRSLLHHAAVWEQAKQQDFVCPFFPKGTPKFHPGMDEEEQNKLVELGSSPSIYIALLAWGSPC